MQRLIIFPRICIKTLVKLRVCGRNAYKACRLARITPAMYLHHSIINMPLLILAEFSHHWLDLAIALEGLILLGLRAKWHKMLAENSRYGYFARTYIYFNCKSKLPCKP